MIDYEDNDSLLDDEDIEIGDSVIEAEVINNNTGKELISHENNKSVIDTEDIASEIAKKELAIRKAEIYQWAEKKKILKGAPKVSELNRVWRKLRKGYSLNKALRGVVSVATWCKWREEYPEIAAMEVQCREDRIDFLQDKIKSVAEQTQRTHMGEVSRDKLIIDSYQTEIDRIDRLTANRLGDMNRNNTGITNLTPIQINFAFRKNK